MRKEAESAGSSKRREADARLMGEKDPPPYGAQQRQDALWKGGNEALPPEWQLFGVGSDVWYQDHNLAMTSRNRPLPGVRLDDPGQLVVSGCEWHISPQGRSYFVNHNTRTTSWKKPIPERPAGSLTLECIIKGHSKHIWSLACVGTSYNVLSASGDGSIRQWTRDGKSVGKPWNSGGGPVGPIAVSPDGTMAASGSEVGRLQLWNIREGKMVDDPWERHTAPATCLDWSPNGLEIASGSLEGTVTRWNPDTGRQIGPTIETGSWVSAIKYSPESDKFASGGDDRIIRVWSKDGKLLIEIKGHDYQVNSLCWSKDGAHIFSGSADGTIRKWQLIDGKEVFVLRGHTRVVMSICVSPDEHHLVSASVDYSVRVWDLRTNRQVGNPLLHDDEVLTVVLFPDGQYIASAGLDKKIYIWSLEAALKQAGGEPDAKLKARATSPRDVLNFSPRSKQQVRNQGLSRYGDDFWGNDTNRPPHHSTTLTRPSPPRRRKFFDFLRFTPSPIVSPTSSRSQHTPEPAIAQSSTNTSSAITPRLYILSKWWPIHTRHVLPPVVDVPLTRGDQRNATAGAPKGNGGFRRDEDFDPPQTSSNRNTDSQEPSAATQTNTGEHGSGRFCFCL